MNTKSICMLATKWGGQEPTGYLMSEKLDGIRAIRQKGEYRIVSRQSVPIIAPDCWLDQLPISGGAFLDGELWLGRGKFQETQSIIQRPVPVDDEWERVKFMSIEPMIAPPPCIVPRPRGHDGVFRLIPQIVCRGPDHLQEFYDGIVEGGGEGVVLRHPNQPYHAGRSPYLVKVKPEVKAIAQVVGYNYDGAHLKSLQCAWNPDTRTPEPPKRVLFDLSNGLTEATRQSPPAEGKRITIVFQSLTPEGKPQFAKITR